MIIVKLIGGLGNQMFQYAAGRRLAEKNRAELKLDIGAFKNYELRKYGLDVFNIREQFATEREIEVLTVTKQGITEKALNRLFNRQARRPASFIAQKHFHFDPVILKLEDPVYLDGHWQSEKYFLDIEDIIRKEFTITVGQDAVNKKTSESITGSESVSIHVRRGDYVSNEATKQYHGICSIEYYHKAINMITGKIKEPHLFVFSDEPDWVKRYLKSNCPVTYIDFNGRDKAYEDLRLMSLCKHHIIANSSFSWWGAWLCQYPDKTVYAPAKWFNGDSINTKDLLPDGWLRI